MLIPIVFVMFASAASATSSITFINGDPPSARVSTGDVDVRSSDGRATVEGRIRRAAWELCAKAEYDRGVFEPANPFKNCYDVAVSGGVSQLDRIASQ
jgi:UrcA family protein